MASLADVAPARMPSVRMPHFTLERGRHSSIMKIGDWTITSTKRPILNGKEVEASEKTLNFTLPEMTFGNNSLSLTYDPHERERDRVEIVFSALNALSEVGVGEGWEEQKGGAVLVSMAESWKNRSAPSSYLSDTPMTPAPVKPHDWTYSSTHAARIAGPSTMSPSSTHELPLRLLARQDPVLDQILFYDDVPLFEDELHDHGESIYNVRIRVMPHAWFVLARLFIRVDQVLFRIFDVRLYHAFGTEEVIREAWGMEADYEMVKARLEKPSDLSPLTDPNWVHQIINSREGPASQTKGKPWIGLGRKVDVLQLPKPSSNGTEMERDMQKLNIS
ncbi:hypothetical protein M231_01757 [Tremella mesenterica]|uniref:Type 2A phosphatase activator TIP41 n=1 Tax=Tremella mesenterica TaxID=5217 RepID=A0A4Q1BSA9_TREME|nr:uncharacterized protein TREMEDRAFT_73192 [Tremella mesenterica DSM 1558]EIW71122.1 hypothetical protein TREMEDRAFT_73192 [Tremella mesenterica DSM 1558]RXK40909.1 hypothetical protein M231_01757 [Tremella mesenterica]